MPKRLLPEIQDSILSNKTFNLTQLSENKAHKIYKLNAYNKLRKTK